MKELKLSAKKEELKNVTKERMNYVAKIYRDSIKEIFTDGKIYLIKFNKGYEIENGKSEVLCPNVVKICYYSWLATDTHNKKTSK